MDMNGIRAGCGWNASDEKIIHHNLIVSDASISDYKQKTNRRYSSHIQMDDISAHFAYASARVCR